MKFTIAATLSAGLASLASAAVIPRQGGVGVYSSCSVPKTVALTFDDGPYQWHKQIVDMLDAAGAKGTFFVNGNNYECIYNQDAVDALQYSYGKGHQIASHTWNHKDLATLTGDALEQQFALSDTAFQKILGTVPIYMRPPFGSYNAEIQQVAANHGQNVIIWDFDSGDSAGQTAEQSVANYASKIAQAPSSILTLNHETYQGTVNTVIPAAITALKAAGYSLVTVAECLGQGTNFYKTVGSPSARDSTWACTV